MFSQIREQPLVGVGFGRTSEFVIEVESSSGLMVPVWQEGGQDPHNGYLYLWAGGGLAALGSFVLILAVFAWDAVRRFRSTTRSARTAPPSLDRRDALCVPRERGVGDDVRVAVGFADDLVPARAPGRRSARDTP